MWSKIKSFLANRWVRFVLWSLLYVLWFVVWTGNWWLLLGVAVIYDLCISRLFFRYVWHYNGEFCAKSPTYKFIYEWVNAILFATVVASLIHIFVFQMYVIPSSSMEKSLLVGDYLYVSKVAYGPKMPNTPVAFPFVHHTMPFSATKKSFSECIRWPYHRLKGFGKVKRNDAVVFNFPAGDTVLLENQAATYYDVLRSYEKAFGKRKGRQKLFDEYTVVTRPVDKREHYIKRCVALPGDTLQIVRSEVFINGAPQEPLPEKQFFYTVQVTAPLSQYAIDNLEITEYGQDRGVYYMALTEAKAEQLRKIENVVEVRRVLAEGSSPDVFPHDDRGWNIDDYGPIWIPAKGATVELTSENLPLYERIIRVYEGNTLEVRDGAVYINGEPATHYTFRMDYYWMMGDNRHNSADSRYWGFVPEDHIVGRAAVIWLSLDKSKSFPANIRWSRLFKRVR